jgi:hypothetical protein
MAKKKLSVEQQERLKQFRKKLSPTFIKEPRKHLQILTGVQETCKAWFVNHAEYFSLLFLSL